ARAFERRVQHVHRDLLPRCAPRMPQLAGRKRGGGDGALRCGTDREGRWQDRVGTVEPRESKRFTGQPRLLPDGLQAFDGIHGVFSLPQKRKGRFARTTLPLFSALHRATPHSMSFGPVFDWMWSKLTPGASSITLRPFGVTSITPRSVMMR